MKHLTLTYLLLLWFSVLVLGQDAAEKHPIDIECERCLSIDSNMTTVGMSNCVLNASEKWDTEMNRYYKLLTELLTTDQVENLKLAQRQWIAFRDKELKFSYDVFYSMQGTLWHNVAAGNECGLVKARALELKGYYDLLTFGNEE